jgi:hypothetical protein
MDGKLFIPRILFALVAIYQGVELTSAHAAGPSSNQCEWSCGKIDSASTRSQLKSQYAQVQSFMKGQSSCSLLESFNSSDRNPRQGALQALAVTARNCSLSTEAKVKNKDFLFQAMMFQGLKLTQETKPFQKTDFTPSSLFKNLDKLTCLNTVSGMESIRAGDIILTKDDAVIVDSVDTDPFGIDAKIRDPETAKRLTLASKFQDVPDVSVIQSRAKTICADWVNDPTQFKISVFHAGGRAPFFPTYGKSTSPWVTAITERANLACFERVCEEIAHRSEVPFPLREAFPSAPKPGVVVVRHNSGAQSCRVNRNSMPKNPDLDCVQCCDFSAKGETP